MNIERDRGGNGNKNWKKKVELWGENGRKWRKRKGWEGGRRDLKY